MENIPKNENPLKEAENALSDLESLFDRFASAQQEGKGTFYINTYIAETQRQLISLRSSLDKMKSK